MIQIAVCDDEDIYLQKIFEYMKKFFSKNKIESNISLYKNGNMLIKSCMRNHFDIVMLDIDMPEINGIDTAEQIRKLNGNMLLVFITNMEHLVFESIKQSPYRFIRKQLFDTEMNEFLISIQRKFAADTIYYKSFLNGELISVCIYDILYFESFGHKIFIHTADNIFRVCDTLENIAQKYMPLGFIRIHKSILVNYRYIFEISNKSVLLDNEVTLPVSRHRINDVKKSYLFFMRENI